MYPCGKKTINGLSGKKGKSRGNGLKGTKPGGCKIALVNIHAAVKANAHVFIKLGIAVKCNKYHGEYKGCDFDAYFQTVYFLSLCNESSGIGI